MKYSIQALSESKLGKGMTPANCRSTTAHPAVSRNGTRAYDDDLSKPDGVRNTIIMHACVKDQYD